MAKVTASENVGAVYVHNQNCSRKLIFTPTRPFTFYLQMFHPRFSRVIVFMVVSLPVLRYFFVFVRKYFFNVVCYCCYFWGRLQIMQHLIKFSVKTK